MSMIRKVARISKSQTTLEGAGVKLNRAFGFTQGSEYDPFLLLDDFRSKNPGEYLRGFPWHPHRGIETITYMLTGEVEHSDSLGNRGVIKSGDVQWMTAGSGIIHQEMPRGNADGAMGGFQLWANLPSTHKMMDPRYREVSSSDIPTVMVGKGVAVKIISGEISGVKGPVQDIITDPQYLDVTIPPDSSFVHPIPIGYSAFVYVIDGMGYFDEGRNQLVADQTLVLFDQGEEIVAGTIEHSMRFFLISGKPIQEPIAWYGPIVMNTQEELRIAFEEYQNGTFIKHHQA